MLLVQLHSHANRMLCAAVLLTGSFTLQNVYVALASHLVTHHESPVAMQCKHLLAVLLSPFQGQ